MPEALYREGGVQGLDVANRDAACRRRLPGRQEKAGRAPPARHRGKVGGQGGGRQQHRDRKGEAYGDKGFLRRAPQSN